MTGDSENVSRISGTGPCYKKRKTTNSVVAQPEIANTVDSQPVKYSSPFQFTWRIDGFSGRNTIKHYSDVFLVGGFKWRVLIYPKGNNVKDYLSMYLDVADSANLPDGWSSYAQFRLTVVNQINNKYSLRKDTQHQFNKLQSHWGFANFIPLGELFDPSRGYLVNNTLVVEVEVTCSVDEKVTAKHLWDLYNGFMQERLKRVQEDLYNGFMQERLKREQEEKKHKIEQNAEALLDTTIVKVVRDEDLAEQIGKDIYFDLVDPNKVRSFRVHDRTTFEVFKKELAKVFGIPSRYYQHLWVWEWNSNHTYRPRFTAKPSDDVGCIAANMVNRQIGGRRNLLLFLEVRSGRDLRPIPLLKTHQCDPLLLFFKLYDPEKEELRYVGSLTVNPTDKPSEILTWLNKLAGYDPDEEIEFYKEIMFEPKVMCEPIDKKLTFSENKIGKSSSGIIWFQKVSAMDNVKHIRYPDVPSYLEYVHSCRVPFSPSDRESLDEQNKNIIAEEMNVDQNFEAQQSNGDKETTYDEGTSKSNTSKSVSVDMEEIDAMIDDDVIAAIDKVLSGGITLSLKFQHSVQRQEVAELDPNLPEQLLQELRDIGFKEDLVEKFKEGLTPNVNFNAVKEKIDANARAFSSHQLEQVGVVVNLLNNIVRMFEKLENLKKELDSAKKSTDQDNEALKETRQKILTSKTSFTNQQTQLNSLDAEIADLKTKLEKLQGDKAKIAEIHDQEKDKITSLNKEVKSIFHRLVDDQIKLKSVEDQIPEAETELESHEKLYRNFKAMPPF